MNSSRFEDLSEQQFFRCFSKAPWGLKLFVVLMCVFICAGVINLICTLGDVTTATVILSIGEIMYRVCVTYGVLVGGSKECRIGVCVLIVLEVAIACHVMTLIMCMSSGADDIIIGTIVFVIGLKACCIVLVFLPATSRYMKDRRDIVAMLKDNANVRLDEKKIIEHADELFTRGFCYENGIDVAKDVVEAAKWYRKAADMGHADALNNLGLMYANGKGVDKDKTEAVWLFNKAAELGNADAQFNLGECYRTGCGVPTDESEAMKWFRKAAEQGNAGGQYALGRCYVDGEGIAKDDAEAVKWFRKAAEQGNAVGQYFLGTCYMDGVGVVKDKAEAVKWLRRAAEQGNEDAIGVLKTLGLDV